MADPAIIPHSMELGPDLPLADFISTWPWDEERIHALALYCSDGRWGLAFDEFCQKHLRIPRYDRWAVPGGPGWLLPSADDTVSLRAAKLQLDLLVEAHGLERIVLISHYGCAYYAKRFNKSPDECLAFQKTDLHLAADTLREWYPAIRVENYLAMRAGSRLSFHGVPDEAHK